MSRFRNLHVGEEYLAIHLLVIRGCVRLLAHDVMHGMEDDVRRRGRPNITRSPAVDRDLTYIVCERSWRRQRRMRKVMPSNYSNDRQRLRESSDLT